MYPRNNYNDNYNHHYNNNNNKINNNNSNDNKIERVGYREEEKRILYYKNK